MSVCRDEFYRWNLKGQSQYKTPTERRETSGFDIVYEGWNDRVVKALRKEYNAHALEEFEKLLKIL